MKTTQKQKLQWLENNIDLSEYSLEDIKAEITNNAFYSNNVKRCGSYQNALADFLQGLPSWLSVPYTYSDILKLRDEWNYKTDEDKFINNYWNALSALLIQYFNKKKLELF